MLKIKLLPKQKIFFTSDTHYGHTNICKGVSKWEDTSKCRDFDTLEKMNQYIVDEINSKVGQDDILIHLGDWSFGGKENIREFREKIVCKNVYLCYGNHDQHIRKYPEYQELFVHTADYMELNIRTNFHRTNLVLMHYPLASWNNMAEGWVHLHGHIHFPKERILHQGKSMDIGFDGNLKIYSLDEIRSIMKHQPINNTSLSEDHHLIIGNRNYTKN